MELRNYGADMSKIVLLQYNVKMTADDDNKSCKPYQTPRLEELGDILSLTLGASGFGGDWSDIDPNQGFS